jgi:hypothetical protein
MKRTDRNRDLLIAAFVVASFAMAPNLTLAADCPVPVENHIPAAPPPPLNIGTVKSSTTRNTTILTSRRCSPRERHLPFQRQRFFPDDDAT